MLVKKFSLLLATASIGIVTLCAVAFPSRGVNGIHAETSAYSVTFTAGDAVTDSYGTYLETDFGCKVYFSLFTDVTFGTVSDGYLYRIGNGGHIRWSTAEAPKDGGASLGSANGFKHLKSISETWKTDGAPVGIVINAYGGDFSGGQITSNGGTITDSDGVVTNTYLNAAFAGGGSPTLDIVSMTLTYTCD